jgi:hypothetical protein
MQVKNYLIVTLLNFFVLSVAASFQSVNAEDGVRLKPNVVLIFVDDMGYGQGQRTLSRCAE